MTVRPTLRVVSLVLMVINKLAELPISWIIMNTTFSPMGTVAYVGHITRSLDTTISCPVFCSAVTLPPILFTPYFQPHWEVHTWSEPLIISFLTFSKTNALFRISALACCSNLRWYHCGPASEQPVVP